MKVLVSASPSTEKMMVTARTRAPKPTNAETQLELELGYRSDEKNTPGAQEMPPDCCRKTWSAPAPHMAGGNG
jgi:hypothetical protein